MTITATEDKTESHETEATRVLIVDDHELLRDGMRQLIIRQPDLEVCGEAATEAELDLLPA